MSSMLNADISYNVWLGKDDPNPLKPIINNKNFIIVDINKIKYAQVIGNDDECVIKQVMDFNYKTNDLQLGVLYRCNLDDCTIRYEDKIHETSYYLFFWYNGFSIEHQNPENPVQRSHTLNRVQFLENTNIVYLNWELIEYEEEKGVFGKTFDNTMGKSNTYYAGDYKTTETFTDDGHIRVLPQSNWNVKDPDGNSFILL